MKVVVFGASGGIGTLVVAQLLDAGHEVTAVVRSGSSWTHDHRHLRIVRVNGLDGAVTLSDTLAGRQAVISTIGPRRASDGPVASTATSAILRAMVRADVGRIVAVSASPVGHADIQDGFLLRRVLRPLVRAAFCDPTSIWRGWKVRWPEAVANGPPSGRRVSRMALGRPGTAPRSAVRYRTAS